MEDIFRDMKWAFVFIDDILICSKNLQDHLKNLQSFYDLVYKHGLVLSHTKMEIGKTEIDFLGFKIQKVQVILKKHVLSVFSHFPDHILEKVQLQRFLGSLNYIRPFYKGQDNDIHVLQQRLKNKKPKWSDKMTLAIQSIKSKFQNLPVLSLPQGTGQLVIETDASTSTWGSVLIEVIEGKENLS